MKNWDYIKKDKNSFYNKPEMAGHHWAKETLDIANAIIKDPKLNKTKIQKFIIANAFRFTPDIDWHYFVNRISKKYVALVKHALKRTTKQNAVGQLSWIESRGGMLRDDLQKTMNVLSYKLDKENYLNSASKSYRWYGFKEYEARIRAEDVVKLMEKDLRVRW